MVDDLKLLLERVIRAIPNYPHEGIIFRDITTLLSDGEAFRKCIDAMVALNKDAKIDYVAGIEARGFILGGAIAHQLNCGFVPIRKKGKLPSDSYSVEYELEYGSDVLEVHKDAIKSGSKVLLVDDLIATGGSVLAAMKLLDDLKGELVACSFVIDLPELGGSKKLRKMDVEVQTLVEFEGL